MGNEAVFIIGLLVIAIGAVLIRVLSSRMRKATPPPAQATPLSAQEITNELLRSIRYRLAWILGVLIVFAAVVGFQLNDIEGLMRRMRLY